MTIGNRVSTGISGLDQAIDMLRLGDNVVWQVQSCDDYLHVVSAVLLVGPGRWGTTPPSLGVPVHFSELSGAAAICEVSYKQTGIMPELSFGSHFFQDIVESGIFYAAIFEGEADVVFEPNQILVQENLLGNILPTEKPREQVVHLARTPGLTLYSDIASQRLLCGG